MAEKEKTITQSPEKRQFSLLFLILVVILMSLPVITTSQEFITQTLSWIEVSTLIQKFIVPFEVKTVIVILNLLGVSATGDLSTIVLQKGNFGAFKAQIIWSCIGWQSLVLLIATLYTGISNRFTLQSRAEAVIFGLLGTFWINIARIVIIYLLAFYYGELVSYLFHTYGGTILVIMWLFFFWWFVYKFVLEEK